MTINAVEGNIGFSANEPFCKGRIPFENFLPGFEPIKFGSDVRPITFGASCPAFGYGALAFEAVNVCGFREFWGWGEDALFLKNCFIGGFCIRRSRPNS